MRVTTDAEVFDDHAEGHEFLSPGGAFFEGLAIPESEDSSVPREGPGHCWLVEQGGAGETCEVFVAAPEGPTPVHSLGDLLDRLNGLSNAEMFDVSGRSFSSSICRPC